MQWTWTRLCWLLDSAFRLLLRPRCVFCGQLLLRDETAVCPRCLPDLPRNVPACQRCADPLPLEQATCGRCQLRAPPFDRVYAPLRYEFPVDAGLKAIKFGHKLQYLPAFESFLHDVDLATDIDAVVAMPLHWRRRAERGFNQADELAKPVARTHGLPLLKNVFRRRYTRSQSGLSATKRRANMRAAFVIRGRIRARHVLIFDDVMTTGESCRQLAHALRAAGATRVSVLVVARASQAAGLNV